MKNQVLIGDWVTQMSRNTRVSVPRHYGSKLTEYVQACSGLPDASSTFKKKKIF